MAIETRQKQIFDAARGPKSKQHFSDIIAIGTVVDTNDPQQLGRLRVVVTAWGDSWNHKTENMPWCMFVSPLAGQTHVGTKGPGIQETTGGVAYGMWGIPKVGAQVVVMSMDENHMYRLVMGCVFDANTPHTMPHGRWMYDDHPKLDKERPKSKPYGPYSSTESLIQPLSQNLQQAFGNNDVAYEWRTRAADYSVSRVDVSQLNQSYSGVQDDLEVTNADDNWVSTQGYQNSRIDPHGNPNGKNNDSHVYSWTTPGFHSISMDDRQENCRTRIRTTSGHQILLDDTNERIYISTAQGNNWIEMDQAGNISIYSSSKVSVRSNADINLSSDQQVRIYGKQGVHIRSNDDIRISAKSDIHAQADKSIHAHAKNDVLVQADKKIHIKAGSNLNITTSDTMNLKAKSNANISTSATMNLNAGGQIIETGSQIHLNGPNAAIAASASAAGDKPANFTSMIPDHEPYGRCMTKSDTGVDPDLSYNDKNMGKQERGRIIPRGMYWRR
jgi:hypothetical protein